MEGTSPRVRPKVSRFQHAAGLSWLDTFAMKPEDSDHTVPMYCLHVALRYTHRPVAKVSQGNARNACEGHVYATQPLGFLTGCLEAHET